MFVERLNVANLSKDNVHCCYSIGISTKEDYKS